jgi:hypothetical protein
MKPWRPKTSPREREARRIVRERSGGVCECCGEARAIDWSHRKARSQGGEWCASNGLDLCRQCHADVTSVSGEQRDYALETGVILERHQDPWETPVNTPHTARKYLGPVQLGDCGGVFPVGVEPIDTGKDWWP